MPGGWGAKSKGVRIGVFWDSVSVASGGATAKLIDPRVEIDRDQNITDTVNKLTVSGSAVKPTNYGNESASGSGAARVQDCTATTVNLSYGKATNVTFSATWSGINYAKATLTASQTIVFPARAYIIPTAPAGFKVTRVSDTSHTLTWTNNVSTASPYQTMKLERWDNISNVWKVLTTSLTSTSQAHIDSTTISDRRYQWRLTVGNSSGSTTVTSLQIATTPLPPKNLSITKSGSTMSLVWTNQSLSATNIQLWHSQDGAAYTLRATLLPTVAGYLHTSINTSATHQYQLRTIGTPGPLYSTYLVSSVISFLQKPNAPTFNLSSAWDFTTAFSMSWIHNPLDGTVQTAAEVQRRPVGGDDLSWVTQAFTVESGWVMPGGTLTNGVTYEFRARTKGDHPSYSDWSTIRLVTGSTRPIATIISPISGSSWGGGNFVVEFAYADPDATDTSGWRITLTRTSDSSVVYDFTRNISTTDTSFVYTVPYLLTNDTTYVIRVYVRDGVGMWSNPAASTVSVSFALPPEAKVDATFNDCSGQIELNISNYPPGPNEVDATLQHIDRWDSHKEVWVPVKHNVPVTNSLPFGDPVYNYATNPGFEAFGGAVEIQRNLIKNPRMRTTAIWVQQGAGTLLKANPDSSLSVTTVGAFAFEGVAAGPTGLSATPIVAANGIHYEVQVRGTAGTLLALQITYYVVGGGAFAPVRQNFTADGTWQRLVYEASPAPVGAAFVQVAVVTQTAKATTFYLLKPLLEKMPSPGLYYDGYTSTMADVTASWTGVENASDSILTIRVPTGAGLPTADYYVMSSSDVVSTSATTGNHSARVYRRVVVGGAADPVWAQVASGLPNDSGQRYTMVFVARTADPGGAVPGSFRLVDASTAQLLSFGTGTITDELEVRVEYFGNGNGTVRLQATIPKASGGQSVWVDELGVFLDTYEGEWFSGATKPSGNYRTSWSGAANASTSMITEYGLDTLSLVDQLPSLSQESRYRVTTQSATPTYNVGDPVVVSTAEVCYSYLNGGQDWEMVAKFAGSPSLSQELGREKALYTFAGRTKPLEYVGDTRSRVYTVAGLTLAVQQAHFCDRGCDGKGMVDMVEAWEKMSDLAAPLCYRDMRGVYKYCSISNVSVEYETSTPFANVSFSLTEVDYTPGG